MEVAPLSLAALQIPQGEELFSCLNALRNDPQVEALRRANHGVDDIGIAVAGA